MTDTALLTLTTAPKEGGNSLHAPFEPAMGFAAANNVLPSDIELSSEVDSGNINFEALPDTGTDHCEVKLVERVEPDAGLVPVGAEASGASSGQVVSVHKLAFPHNLIHKIPLVISQRGGVYALLKTKGNVEAVPLGSRRINNLIRDYARGEGLTIRKSDISEISELLRSQAESAGHYRDVWYRVAPCVGGIVIDVGDDQQTRLRVTAAGVEVLEQDCETLFFRTPVARALVLPTESGDLALLKKHLNLMPEHQGLFIAWLAYTLAHPKVSTSKYVILLIQGDQGTGKTFLCNNIILRLLDPNQVGVQVFPGNVNDFSIAAQNSHVLCYDNVRAFKQSMADVLCVAATGGAMANRALYTDSDMNVRYLHTALVLNGIHDFIDQPDLAQRCLPIRTLHIDAAKRQSEHAMAAQLETELPMIFRGLLDLIANILHHLPEAEVTHSERMYDFVRWLAATEKAQGISPGTYQQVYSEALRQAQLDSIEENALAGAILQFAAEHIQGQWSGTPLELLNKLLLIVPSGTQHSREWPKNAIALSKRLTPMKASLLTQGIDIEFHRAKHRTITIKVTGGQHDDHRH